ncbi:hypothetical protein Scep_003782 [Stephania cephalantha]|uniref:Uncharacterized protein n=1 Tax=Stephania cephalantha TaxID=152367 RepID=A0AAP0PUS8_9MAGN
MRFDKVRRRDEGNAIDRKRTKIVPIIDRFYGEFFPNDNGMDPSLHTIDQRKIENAIMKVFPSTGVIGKTTMTKIMLSIFGVPAAALFIKGRFYPKVGIKDEYLIPVVTSATVLALSMMRMI